MRSAAAPASTASGGAGGPISRGQALDDENNRLLLERLRGMTDRRAHYVCAAAYVDGSRELVCRGAVHGSIVDDARGTSGFGYDPYFWSDELGRTFGEVDRVVEGAGESPGASVSCVARSDWGDESGKASDGVSRGAERNRS